jgi:VanZ family protein
MRAGLLRTSLRFLTWASVILLAILSLMPFEEIEAARTDLPGQVEHIIAYAGSTAIAMAGYGLNRGHVRIIGWFWLYAVILEYLQNFSPGRNPAVVDFAASAFGALCGGVAVVLLWRSTRALNSALCCFRFTLTSHVLWTGQPLAYPAVQKSGAAADLPAARARAPAPA